jgi:hypothetical protein
MIENETGKPKRKKKVSEPEETSVAKKTGRNRKTTEKKIELKESETAAEAKPVKKTRSAKKVPVEAPEKSAAAERSGSAPETIEPSTLAETPNIIEGATDTISKPKSRKRKPVAAKKALDAAVGSPVKKKAAKAKKEKTENLETPVPAIETREQTQEEGEDAAAPEKEESPIFKELAEPKLPVLPQENRARLQMQSPNRIFFYWSVKHNPFETLNRAFSGRAANYTLTIKLVNLDNDTEEVYPVEPSGSWWFNVDSNTNYRAEIGFFAQTRPFVRLMYSNTVQTPRSAPSPNRDLSMDFAVTSEQFSEVLDASGYAQDAFEVAISGDDQKAADRATQDAFFRLSGSWTLETDLNELRSILFALASKASLESLRDQMSAGLYAQIEAIMRENGERLAAEKVRAALKENFEFEDEPEEVLTPVFGASAINFPRKPRFPKFAPVSSSR